VGHDADANGETTNAPENNLDEQAKGITGQDGNGHLPNPDPGQHLSRLSGAVEAHPESAAILRQVEYYFSDNNLASDAHLLSRTGPTGDGWVSISEILGFKKMRAFKPKARVIKSLESSDQLELLKGKFIRRKTPLSIPIRVVPKISEKRDRDRKLVDKPWLTKGILSASGFEEYATDGPITPQQYEEEKKLFDPEESFVTRIDAAVNRFLKNRKMHQYSAGVFQKFLTFGGFSNVQHMFTGGIGKKELEEYDKEQIDQITARYGVSDRALQGLDEDQEGGPSWVVDFEGMAKAFFSSEFMQRFDWTNEQVLLETTNLLRKFYNYLLGHDACPEYRDDIFAARAVCDLAEEELPKLAQLDRGLPGSFNIACSTLHGGMYAHIRPIDPEAEWVHPDDRIGLSDRDAWAIFSAAIAAHGTEAQTRDILAAHHHNQRLPVRTTTTEDEDEEGEGEHDIGFEILRIEPPSDASTRLYADDRLTHTIIQPTAQLHCVAWDPPHRPSRDLPAALLARRRAARHRRPYVFVVDAALLRSCVPGMKFEATFRELACGVLWLDAVDIVYPSFFTWTRNELLREWREPGPPKAWMRRRDGGKEEVEQEEVVVVEGGEDGGGGTAVVPDEMAREGTAGQEDDGESLG
jgi:hypothetical protein